MVIGWRQCRGYPYNYAEWKKDSRLDARMLFDHAVDLLEDRNRLSTRRINNVIDDFSFSFKRENKKYNNYETET